MEKGWRWETTEEEGKISKGTLESIHTEPERKAWERGRGEGK